MLLLTRSGLKDVAARFLTRYFDRSTNTYHVKLEWWNVVFEPKLICKDVVRIKEEDMDKWRPL